MERFVYVNPMHGQVHFQSGRATQIHYWCRRLDVANATRGKGQAYFQTNSYRRETGNPNFATHAWMSGRTSGRKRNGMNGGTSIMPALRSGHVETKRSGANRHQMNGGPKVVTADGKQSGELSRKVKDFAIASIPSLPLHSS